MVVSHLLCMVLKRQLVDRTPLCLLLVTKCLMVPTHLPPTVSIAGQLGDGDVHDATVEFTFRLLAPTTGNYTIGETVTGSITGISATVEGWNYATKILTVGSIVPNSGNYLWNKNELITVDHLVLRERSKRSISQHSSETNPTNPYK